MLADALADIDQHYIQRVDLRATATDGLQALGEIDQGLSVRPEADRLNLIYQGRPAGTFALSGPMGSADWAVLMANVLAAARNASPTFNAADSELVYAAIFNAIVSRLDFPFSRYAGRDQATQDRATREGYAGIGVHISIESDGARITSVIPGTPAERIGLHADDAIVAVNGQPVQGLDQQTVVGELRGPAGSRVILTVRPSGRSALVTMTAVRDNVAVETVAYQRKGDIGYFRVFLFGQGTADSLRGGVEKALGSGVRGIVLDLRDDPGGLLDQGVAVADLFLDRGRIVSIRGRDPKNEQDFNATSGDITHGLPVAVLINASTASASEVVAAALQDSGRAIIIGSNSFGKGTVQAVHRLPNGGELILTIARFYAPSGYTLYHLGVLPTICTSRGAADAQAILTQLEAGGLPPLPIAKRDSTPPDDTADLEQLRAICPGAHGTNAVDLDIASRLLTESGFFAKAVALADPRILAPN